MSINQLVYWSSTGVTRRVAEPLGGIEIAEYTGGSFILVVPSYGAPRTGQHVPRPVKKFLAENADQMVAVVGVGNTVFGPEFCLGAKKVSERFQVPLIAQIDVVATPEDLVTIRKEMGWAPDLS